MTWCKTKEQLDREYAETYECEIPDELSPPIRETYERELAYIEGRDDFRFSLVLPGWIPEELRKEYLQKLGDLIINSVAEMVEDARVKYKPNNKGAKA